MQVVRWVESTCGPLRRIGATSYFSDPALGTLTYVPMPAVVKGRPVLEPGSVGSRKLTPPFMERLPCPPMERLPCVPWLELESAMLPWWCTPPKARLPWWWLVIEVLPCP